MDDGIWGDGQTLSSRMCKMYVRDVERKPMMCDEEKMEKVMQP